MLAHVFPGQGSQAPGMGQEVYNSSFEAKSKFEKANDVLGFRLTDVMFRGSVEDLKQTNVAQPAIFIHSVALAMFLEEREFVPQMMAGHSLGEFSSLVAAKSISLDTGIRLVKLRAEAMQRACEKSDGTMAAVLRLEDSQVENVCAEIDGIVVPANYNSPGQLVISGERKAVEQAAQKLNEIGGRVIVLKVAGAFHSELMRPAYEELAKAIDDVEFSTPFCPIYQNVTALPTSDVEEIRANLKEHILSPVRWVDTVNNMVKDGATKFQEIGPGKVLNGLIKKINPEVDVESIGEIPDTME